MHHGTCVTHVPWFMSGSLTCGAGENVPGIPGDCATRKFTYLARGPWILQVNGLSVTHVVVCSYYLDWVCEQKSVSVHIKYTSLTHWGRLTHICIGKLTIIGSDDGLSPGLCQAVMWTNAGILLIRTSGTNFSDIFICHIIVIYFWLVILGILSFEYHIFVSVLYFPPLQPLKCQSLITGDNMQHMLS